MRVAVLGTGMVGRTLAERLAELGHDVTVGTRDAAAALARTDAAEEGALTLEDWMDDHAAVRLADFSAAASGAELVINATAGHASLAALGAAGDRNLNGKVIIDVSNPLDFSGGFPPTLTVKDTDSLGEQIQAAFPQARVVKTLNTLTALLMAHPELVGEGQHTVFVSGDDADAKAVVVDLLHAFGHSDIIDLGGISTARGTEMYLALWVRTMLALGTGMFNIKVVR